METTRLYYEDVRMKEFAARVVSCREAGEVANSAGGKCAVWKVELDRTAFYPEGGGQAADRGKLGGAEVLHVREEGERVLHLLAEPLMVGEIVQGAVDYDHRFDLMQQHSGEHIVSGIIHSRYGYHNVGFHMGWDSITIDFDGVIPLEELPEIERLANGAIFGNKKVRIWTPSPEKLPQVAYRTKRALPWPVRIVQIPGFDSCACCGLHVEHTGEIGLIKLMSCVKFRTGSRIEMLSGRRAFDFLNQSHNQNRLVSAAFSAKLFETGAAAARMNELVEEKKRRIAGLETEIFRMLAERCAGKGDVLLFREGLDGTSVRRLADAAAGKCGGTAAVFSGTDDAGYSYCLIRKGADLRGFNREMVAALEGRGGGKDECMSGTVKAGRESILAYFKSFCAVE